MIACEAQITSIDRPINLDGLFDEIYDYQLFYLLSSNIKENRVGENYNYSIIKAVQSGPSQLRVY
jgi:hypothetical protein